MQGYLDQLVRNGKTLQNDTSSRLKERPRSAYQNGLVVDLGATQWTTSSQTKKSSQTNSTTSKGAKRRNKTLDITSDESDDALDLFSQPSDDITSPRAKTEQNPVENADYVLINGERHQYHSDFKPKPPLPKFNKIKRTDSEASTSKLDDTAKNENSSRPRPVPKMRVRPQGSTPTVVTSHKPDSARALRDRSPNQRIPPSPIPAVRPRPKPRPAFKGKKARTESDSDSTTVRRKKPAPFPVSPIAKDAPTNFPRPSPLSSQPQDLPRQPAPFPLSLPSPEGKGKSKARDIRDTSFSDEDEDELAVQSCDDLCTRGRGNVRPFPMSTQVLQSIGQSPGDATSSSKKRLSDGGEKGREKKKRKENQNNTVRRVLHELNLSDHDGDSDEFVFLDPSIDPKTLCPYCDTPLPTSPTPLLHKLLATAKVSSIPDPRPTNPLGRKASIAVYVGVCQRHRFESVWLPRARQEGWKEAVDWEEVRRRVEVMKDDLRAILEDENGGELEELDETEQKSGSDDDDNDDDDEEQKERERARNVKDDEECKGPRKKCVFWKEIMKAVKSKGVRGVVGVRGQYDSFEKTQPGYYGEQGSVIIHQTLYTLFPPASIPPTLTHPLSPADFLQRILAPQVGLTLIQEDLGLSTKKALMTMRESTSYGVAMFPADEGGEGDGGEWVDGEGGNGDRLREERMGVADKIVLERARRRRKELEVEEKEENEAFARQLAEEKEMNRLETNGKPKEKVKAKRSGKQKVRDASEASSVEVVATAGPRPKQPISKAKSLQSNETNVSERPRPIPRTRPLSQANTEPVLTNSTGTERPRPKPRMRKHPSIELEHSDTLPADRQQSSDSDGPSVGPNPSIRPKPKSKAKPTGTSRSPIAEGPEESIARGITTGNTNRHRKHASVDTDLAPSDAMSETSSKNSFQSKSRSKKGKFKAVTTDEEEVEVVSASQETPVKRDRRGKKRVVDNKPDDDATPRPKVKGGRGSSVASDAGSSTSSNFLPLKAARERKAQGEIGDVWSYRMSAPNSDIEIEDTMSSDDTTRIHRSISPRRKRSNKDSWLLSDQSHSSFEGD